MLNVDPLITERVDFSDFNKIYGNMHSTGSVASLLIYPEKSDTTRRIKTMSYDFSSTEGIIGIIGAGNFTKMTMLPILKRIGASIKYIASAGGLSATFLAKKYGIKYSTTDYKDILNDPQVDTVIITTRHDLHAPFTIEALNAGKHVFVEKPLALNPSQLEAIEKACHQHRKTVTVGYNRRFSPHIVKMKNLIGQDDGSLNIIATMNAGFIPPEVWVHDPETGGGRIVGEACHFIDLITFLAGSPIESVCMSGLGTNPGRTTDNASILIKCLNGSQGIINYFSNGHKSYSKERIEVYSMGRTLILDNFRKLTGYGFKGFTSLKTKLDKGHGEQFTLLLGRIQTGGEPLIPLDSLLNSTRASFAAIESLKAKSWISVE
jgi:predicted dehydrogenase